MFLIALMLSCATPSSEPSVPEEASSAEAFWLQRADWGSPVLEDLSGVAESYRSNATDWVYLVSPLRASVHTITPANVQPRGSYCVGGDGDASSCTGLLRDVGNIATNTIRYSCFDDKNHRVALVQDSGRVEFLGASAATEHWRHENAVYEVAQPGPSAQFSSSGPCFFQDGQLWTSGDGQLTQTDVKDGILHEQLRHELDLDFQQLIPLEEGRALGHQTNGLWRGIDLESGSAIELPRLGQTVSNAALDPSTNVVWMTDRDHLGLVTVQYLDDSYVITPVGETVDQVIALQVDSRMGTLGALERDESGRSWLRLYRDGVLHDSKAVTGRGLGLLPAGRLGQYSVLTKSQNDEILMKTWRIRDPSDIETPLGVFLVTTLEEPFLNLEMPCDTSDEEEGGFRDIVELVRANMRDLSQLGIPVAVGVTWEFVFKAKECDESRIFEEISDYGFELGHMVHSRPCFNCTDGSIPGVNPAHCTPSSPHYALDTDPDACWPGDDEYCDLDDSVCWSNLVGNRALDVDYALPGGAGFIFGADRHGLWGWDWVEGYRTFPRANGENGYELSLFAAQWAYPDVASFDDPRGKEPAPRRASQMGNPWFVANSSEWDINSSFSDLMYLPGYSIATIKAGEHQGTGLHLLHLSNSDVEIALDSVDMRVLTGLMAQAVAHRDRAAMGSWYFHLRDLGSWSLLDEGDDGLSAIARLSRWKDSVEKHFSSDEFLWMSPSELRARRLQMLKSSLTNREE